MFRPLASALLLATLLAPLAACEEVDLGNAPQDKLTDGTQKAWIIQQKVDTETGEAVGLDTSDLNYELTFFSGSNFIGGQGSLGGAYHFDDFETPDTLFMRYSTEYIRDSVIWYNRIFYGETLGTDTLGIDTLLIQNLETYQFRFISTFEPQFEVTLIPDTSVNN
mgnify:CR=1 FL=1